MSDLAKLVALRVRQERKAAGFSQGRLADASGIHRPNISRIERGDTTPSLETLGRVAAALNVPLARLVSEPNTVA